MAKTCWVVRYRSVRNPDGSRRTTVRDTRRRCACSATPLRVLGEAAARDLRIVEGVA